MGQIDNTDIAKKIFNFIDNRNTTAQGISTNVELIKATDRKDGTNASCDFKENWRCN
jgi:alkaline phosphatase